ncbi:MAG: SulP family inorganic anion transporter [Saprospiraceae bacterium]
MAKHTTLQKIFPFLVWLPSVNKRTIQSDFIAGLTGAVIVLPQGVAFAMIAGLPPIYGLYTAIVAPIVAALFGSSNQLYSGPTTPLSIVIFATISQLATETTAEFIALTITLTFLTGLIQLLLGVIRLGAIVNFVSHTVVVGFTAGAGLLITSKQLKYVFGIPIESGTSFGDTLFLIIKQLPDTNPYVFVVAFGTLLSAILLKKYFPKIPYMLLAMGIGSILAIVLGGTSNGITFVKEMPAQLPPFALPSLEWGNIQTLLPNAFALALLGLIEAVAIARSIAMKTNQRIDSNQEFIGQGLSNIVGSLFSNYASSGSFSRSGVNHQSGAKTPLAVVFASILVLLIVLFVAPLTAYLPIPAMGGIILLVGYNLIDFKHIREILKVSRLETIVLLVTMLGTVFLQLEFAIYLGILFSLVFYLQKTSKPNVTLLAPQDEKEQLVNIIRQEGINECPQLKIVRIDGSIYFGAIEHITSFFEKIYADSEKKVLIVANGINFIDLAGAEWMTAEAERWRKKGGQLYISGLKTEAQDILIKGGFKEKIGADAFFSKKKEAIKNIYQNLDLEICKTCTNKIFMECKV